VWAGERAVVSGSAAAWWYGMFARAPEAIEVTCPRGLGLRPYPGVRVRRDLGPADQLCRDGIWLTDIPPTTLETAIAIPDGSAFLDRALLKHVGFEWVYRPTAATWARQDLRLSVGSPRTAPTRRPSGSWCASCATPV
jgi:hypothetical protein